METTTSLRQQLEDLERDALYGLERATSARELDAWRLQFIAGKGRLAGLIAQIGTLPAEERPGAGEAANRLKAILWSRFRERQSSLPGIRDGQSPEVAAPAPGAEHWPLYAWFLGPKAEHAELWQELLDYIFQDYIHWRRNYFPGDPATISRVRRREPEMSHWVDALTTHLDRSLSHLKADQPFYSPRYIAHMLSEQTLPSVLGYFAGMLYNPNNVTDESAPVTVELELQVGRMVAEMLGYDPGKAWAHICSGGTVANLEALWVARSVQFIPFIVRDFSRQRHLAFEVKTADGRRAVVNDLDDRELIGLRPNESIYMPRHLARYVIQQCGWDEQRAIADIDGFWKTNPYNVRRHGFYAVANRIGLRPRIFVSAAAHYSLKKAANVLGYGEDAIVAVPVTSRFRVDVQSLGCMLHDLDDRSYVAALVGIVGTTQEGAVDPIHELVWLRDQVSREKNRAFWLHVDAAWGGYIASLFRGHALPGHRRMHLDEICRAYDAAIGAHERVRFVGVGGKNGTVGSRTVRIAWSDFDVYKAFLAIKDADSVTVDPHKLGYVPYPAGIVAFKTGLVTELITQRAQYISEAMEGLKAIEQPIAIDAVGPYILEGSKPGAAALSCWLAHRSIPLTAAGHGQIMKATLLSARKLHAYLEHHRHLCDAIHRDVCGEERCADPFTFLPLFDPDTNIVDFVVVPMERSGEQLRRRATDLGWVNRVTEMVYNHLILPRSPTGKQFPYAQEFFVSRTRFTREQYSAHSLGRVLERIGVTEQDYEAHGIFVLRATIMHALYAEAERQGSDYLYEFLKYLHKVTHLVTETPGASPATPPIG